MEKVVKKYFKAQLNTIDSDGEYYFYLKVENQKELPIPKQKTILLVLDKSGSMQGENIKHTKLVVKKFLDFFREQMNDASINIIIFDSEQNVVKDANKLPKNNLNKLIDQIVADDCTFFAGVLKSMSNFIKNKKNIEDLSIIFMTDGKIEYEDDMKNDFKMLNEQLEELKSSLKFVNQVDIHTIGLGKNHDPFLLEKIIMLKKANSSFQFIINETGIDPSFNAVKDMIYANNITGQLLLSDANTTELIDLELTESEGKFGVRIWEWLNKTNININNVNKDESYVILNLRNGTIQERFYLNDIYKNNSNQEAAYTIHLSKIKKELEFIFNNLKIQANKNVFDINELDNIKKEKTKLRNAYQNVAIKLYKVKDIELKESLFKLCEEISEILKVIEEIMIAAYKNQVKSEVLGKAIQLAHKNIKKKKYIDQLESRLPTTVRLFNKQDTLIKEISQKIEKDSLYQKYGEIAENYKCFLSCNDFIESIMEGDCLCVTFAISRSEQAIVVPSSIKITAIYPTIISAQSFLNSIKYSINLNFEENSQKNEQVVVGVAQESINGALPIFLCPEHWDISSILIDRVLGWIVTLDPMGYHINQKMTFPYILLEYVVEQSYKNTESHFIKNYFKLILETCLSIMILEDKLENSNFKSNLQKLYESYKIYGTVRTPDSISKSSFFFIKLYCSVILQWYNSNDGINQIYFYLIEEELRRIQTKLFNNYNEYMNINIENDLIFKNEKDKQSVIDKYTTEYSELYMKECTLLRIIHFMILNFPTIESIDFKAIKLSDDPFSILSELRLENKIYLYSMYFQNQIHHSDSVRRKAFKDNVYFNCIANPMEVFINYGNNIKQITESREKQIEINNHNNINVNNLKKRFRNLEVIGLLSLFRESHDLNIAEGLLLDSLKIKPGKSVHYYFNIFYIPDKIPNLYEKLIMLKEKSKNFKNAIKCKHIHDLCYSPALTDEQIINVFGVKKIPKSLKRLYSSKYPELFKK